MSSKSKYSITKDISKAKTLPREFYSDPETWSGLREKAFVPGWHLVGDVNEVKTPGSVKPFTLYEGFMDEPLVLTRDEADRIHCLSNVCTHRAALVCKSPGVAKHLKCPYHGRKYALDGRFEFMPEFDECQDFPTAADNLPMLKVKTWGPLVFASMNPGWSFEDWFEPVLERCGWLPIDEFRFDANRSRDYLVHGHWALYCDNYLEGFHIPYVHHSLNDALDYGAYSTELFEWSNMQLGVAKGGDDVFVLPKGHPDKGKEVAAWYFFLFPNLTLNFYPWGLSINIIKPITPDRTRVSFLSYVWKEEKLTRGAGAELDRVEREDEEVVESVQRGLRSRLYEHGRFSPTREQGVHHFHRLLARVLK